MDWNRGCIDIFSEAVPFCRTYSTFSGFWVGGQILISIHYNQSSSNLDNELAIAGMALSIVTNAVTTTMIAYRLWYVAVGWIHWMQWVTMQ